STRPLQSTRRSELGNRLGWDRWIDHHEKGRADDASNRCDVAEKNEIEVVVTRDKESPGRAGAFKSDHDLGIKVPSTLRTSRKHESRKPPRGTMHKRKPRVWRGF